MADFIADNPAGWSSKPNLAGYDVVRSPYETEAEYRLRKERAVVAAREAARQAKDSDPQPGDPSDFGCYE